MKDEPQERTPADVQQGWVHRRREKIYQEIMANRRGEYTVPTWVLATILGVIIAAWVAVVYFA